MDRTNDREATRRFFKALIREIIAEDFAEDSDDDVEAHYEDEENTAPSNTRKYHREKSREYREKQGLDTRSGQQGRVTDPEHDRRLKQNRGSDSDDEEAA